MQNVLTALKDIPGVVGSFVLNEKGLLVSREMPKVYPDEIYPEMGRRLVGVYEAIASQAIALGDLVLKFDSYWFLCRRTAQCFLGVLTTEAVNYPALRMATNVALKQIDAEVASLPPLLVEKVAAAPVVEPTSVVTKQKRFWRGTPVD
jgi:predicted regulator of Ras-like GTPase activity (Roadblock/LC7/MglB family)